jgi:TRAP-type mannitol/chloroaromatic compound transport system substrate-binding protein
MSYSHSNRLWADQRLECGNGNKALDKFFCIKTYLCYDYYRQTSAIKFTFMQNSKAKSKFQPIFDYIDETKKEILAQVASKKDIKKLQDSVDAYAKQTRDYYQEVTIVVAKVNRMEAWIQRVASKVGVEYEV